MGLFKDFKDDFSDAVDELVPTDDSSEKEDVMVNTLDEDVDVDSELDKLDGLLEQVAKKVDEPAVDNVPVKPATNTVKTEKKENTSSYRREDHPVMSDITTDTFNKASEVSKDLGIDENAISDETAVITLGMTITGDLDSTGSITIEGAVKGNVKCNGKLVVNGTVRGNSVSSEFFADNAKVEGEVATSGTAKVGAGSVIVGNITATSAVIAGAVKGDIDVQGPVVVDTSAVVMGNIKSRSVQINNGAVIEGFCSQSYADVDVESVFKNVEA
jgi:cytoskeletal protein CcmA (bactofilin family)